MHYLTGSILDIGCGTGNLQSHIRPCVRYTGVTSNELEAAEGIKRGRDIRHLDAHDLSKISGSYNWFVMWDSLEHFYSPFIALLEAKKKIKTYGQGLIFMPGQNWLGCHDHIHTMTVPQMFHLFKRTGFKLIRCDERKYDNPNTYCEGMAVYIVENDPTYKPYYES